MQTEKTEKSAGSLVVTVFLGCAISGALLADVSYESRTQLTGGSLFPAVLALEPPDRGARKPLLAAHVIKGNRMATITKDHITILDLGPETIFEIDLIKKTYFSRTFAQMKEILDQAMKATSDAGAEAAFEVSAKSTGRTKAIEFFSAEERMVTANLTGASTQPVTQIVVDSWMLTVPGYGEAGEFRRRLAEKLGYAYALGLSDIGMVQPELLPGFEELAKILNQGEGMPVESTIRMGGPAAGDLSSGMDAMSAQKGVVSGALNRLGGIRRKEPVVRPAAPGVLVEMTRELSNFNSGFADESKFKVPDGFKQVQPPATR